MFFSFGAVFFLALPSAFNTLGLSKALPLIEIMGRFRLHFVYAANVFSGLANLALMRTMVCFQTISAYEVITLEGAVIQIGITPGPLQRTGPANPSPDLRQC
jgi:hypothetical protein